MAGSAKPKRYPYDPRGGTDPPFYDPATGHFAEGLSFAVDPTRIDLTAHDKVRTAR